MWIPYELTSKERSSSDFVATLIDHMIARPHHSLVAKHCFERVFISQNRDSANNIIKSLLDCEIVFIGNRHGQLRVPFCGLSHAPDLQLARMEYLLDYSAESAA
jgi:hypothetical protein